MSKSNYWITQEGNTIKCANIISMVTVRISGNFGLHIHVHNFRAIFLCCTRVKSKNINHNVPMQGF